MARNPRIVAFIVALRLEAWIWSLIEGRSLELVDFELGLELLRAGGSIQGDSGPYTASTSCGRCAESPVPRAQFFACGARGRTPGGGRPLDRGKWLMHMEKLFRDTFVEERDRVWLATHHLDGEAYRWWLDLQENPSTDLASISWKKFKELLLAHYFPISVKRKMEQDLRNLRQGDRTVAEYEREFSRLLHCVPFVVRDDEDKARIFERGLRPSIFRFVQSSNLQTYREVVDRALIVESGVADVQEQREARDKGKAKRPAAEGASQTHSRRPPKHPRSQQRGRGSAAHRGGPDRRRPSPCVICGGPYRPPQCPQRAGRCYQCGQEGHIRTECPRVAGRLELRGATREDLGSRGEETAESGHSVCKGSLEQPRGAGGHVGAGERAAGALSPSFSDGVLSPESFYSRGPVPGGRDRSPWNSVAAACEATGPWRMRPVLERDFAGRDRSHAGRDWFPNVGFAGQAERPVLGRERPVPLGEICPDWAVHTLHSWGT
uniref:CCHC-type domain-containing protein n=1 Tax=Ananas comosus var. bracteatus TaxID=296719 RepID=A0A6V7NWH3_ANACO|nr:unnamed protein product [Ananas comosus var. bracteatus]